MRINYVKILRHLSRSKQRQASVYYSETFIWESLAEQFCSLNLQKVTKKANKSQTFLKLSFLVDIRQISPKFLFLVI